MISQSAEYSLRAVLCLASASVSGIAVDRARADAPGRDGGAALTASEIAARTRVPAGYLSKLLSILSRAGLITSQRGLNGGFVLRIDPSRITLLDVVAAVEPSHRVRECPLHDPAHAMNLCPLHRRLDAAAVAVERILRDTTIAQVLAESTDQPLPICAALQLGEARSCKT